MPNTDGANAIPIPVGTDANNVPADLASMRDEIDKGSLGKRLAQAVLDALPIAQKVVGMLYYNSTINRFVRWDGAVYQRLAEMQDVNLAMPIGSITVFAATGGWPDNWLFCNGSTFSAAAYPELASVLGGNTLPDLRDRFVLGYPSGGGQVFGGKAGSRTKTIGTNNLPAHSHGMSHTHGGSTNNAGLHDHGGGFRTGTWYHYPGSGGSTTYKILGTDGATGVIPQGDHSHSIGTDVGTRETTENAGGSQALDVMPPHIVLAYIIRAK